MKDFGRVYLFSVGFNAEGYWWITELTDNSKRLILMPKKFNNKKTYLSQVELLVVHQNLKVIDHIDIRSNCDNSTQSLFHFRPFLLTESFGYIFKEFLWCWRRLMQRLKSVHKNCNSFWDKRGLFSCKNCTTSLGLIHVNPKKTFNKGKICLKWKAAQLFPVIL